MKTKIWLPDCHFAIAKHITKSKVIYTLKVISQHTRSSKKAQHSASSKKKKAFVHRLPIEKVRKTEETSMMFFSQNKHNKDFPFDCTGNRNPSFSLFRQNEDSNSQEETEQSSLEQEDTRAQESEAEDIVEEPVVEEPVVEEPVVEEPVVEEPSVGTPLGTPISIAHET